MALICLSPLKKSGAQNVRYLETTWACTHFWVLQSFSGPLCLTEKDDALNVVSEDDPKKGTAVSCNALVDKKQCFVLFCCLTVFKYSGK